VLQEGGISRMTLYNHFKSKDELIVAALRRRDEIFRNKLMKFVESKTDNPLERILAVFDFHEQWFTGSEFFGCMFINASAEFPDPQSPPRRVASDHKRDIVAYLRDLCEAAKLQSPAEIAEELNLMLEGSIVTAQVVGLVKDNGADPGAAARLARTMAARLIGKTTK